MRTLSLLALTISCLIAGTADATPKKEIGKPHTLIGKWLWTRERSNCTETYIFRADGIALVTSGEERSESTYTISPLPSSKGFFTLMDKIIKDHGGRDCAGDTSDSTGHEATTYIIFHPSGETMLICQFESIEKCFGPLKRVQE